MILQVISSQGTLVASPVLVLLQLPLISQGLENKSCELKDLCFEGPEWLSRLSDRLRLSIQLQLKS